MGNLADLARSFVPSVAKSGDAPKKHYIQMNNEEWVKLVTAFGLTEKAAYKNILLGIAEGKLELRQVKEHQ